MAESPRTHDAATGFDSQVLAAQRHNASRMNDAQLRREWQLVSGFPERPPIRVAYLDVLRDEFCVRGFSEPEDVRDAR